MKITDDMRLESGALPAYAFPGGYPLFYIAKDNGVLCPKCANEYTPERDNAKQLEPIECDINYEDSQLFCEHCNTCIESAYEDGGESCK